MDPISAKLTETALTGMNGANNPAISSNNPTFQTEQTSFGRILDNHMDANQSANTQLLQYVDNLAQESSAPQIKAIPGNEIQLDVNKVSEVQNVASTNPTGVFDILKEVNSSQTNMDQIVERLTSSSKITPQEMIRYQILASSHTVMYESVARGVNSVHTGFSSLFNMGVG